MSERPPLRVRDWSPDTPPAASSSDPGPPPPPPKAPGSGSPPPGAAPPPPEAKGPPPAPSAGGLPLPKTVYFGFDLLRIPLGLLRRWWLPLPLGILGLLLGIFAGRALFEAQATTTARLISRDPEAFAASRTAYTPSRVQGATLLQALASPQVADAVAARLEWDRSARQIAEMVAVHEVRRTDFVEIVVHGPLTAGEAATLARTWAEEAIAFTSGLQAQESGDLRRHLEGQRDTKDRELAATNAQIAALREDTGVIDAEREIEAYLRSLSTFHQEFESNRVDLEAIGFQLAALRTEIRKHSPGFEELKAEEARLEELAEYLTPQNPRFQDAQDRVDALRRRLNRSVAADDIDFSEFTGTYVGNALFLQILELEARSQSLQLRQEKLDTLRLEARERLRDLPDVALQASRLMESAQALRAARDALSNRIQEVAGFEELAPGYYRIFRVPSARDVYVGSTTKKTLIVGLFFGTVFFAMGLVGAAALEFLDRTLRTAGEAADIFGTKALGGVTCRPLPPAAAQQLWARVIGPLEAGRTRVFWVPQDHPAERQFWDALAAAASALGTRPLLLHARGTAAAHATAYTALDALPADDLPPGREPLRVALDPARLTLPLEREGRLRRDCEEIWLVFHGPLREPMATTLRTAPDLLILTALAGSKKDFWELQASLLRHTGNLRGLIGLG
jgi:polyhydroxyalkanoate synthesis regulator phasin